MCIGVFRRSRVSAGRLGIEFPNFAQWRLAPGRFRAGLDELSGGQAQGIADNRRIEERFSDLYAEPHAEPIEFVANSSCASSRASAVAIAGQSFRYLETPIPAVRSQRTVRPRLHHRGRRESHPHSCDGRAGNCITHREPPRVRMIPRRSPRRRYGSTSFRRRRPGRPGACPSQSCRHSGRHRRSRARLRRRGNSRGFQASPPRVMCDQRAVDSAAEHNSDRQIGAGYGSAQLRPAACREPRAHRLPLNWRRRRRTPRI